MRPIRKSALADSGLSRPAIERLLATANPVSAERLESAELSAAFDRVGEQIIATRPRARTRHGGRLAPALTFAAIALVAAAVATGAMLTTHTGFFPKVAGTENDRSEFLRTDAPDFPPLVRKLVHDIRFPPGYRREAYINHYLNEPTMKPDANGVPNTVQAAGVRGTVGFFSLCAWRGYWMKAHAHSDASSAAIGASGLLQVASSDAIKKTDSWWPKYVALAHNEAHGDASWPPDLERWYAVNCSGLADLGAPK
jgi:hypothetical protein